MGQHTLNDYEYAFFTDMLNEYKEKQAKKRSIEMKIEESRKRMSKHTKKEG